MDAFLLKIWLNDRTINAIEFKLNKLTAWLVQNQSERFFGIFKVRNIREELKNIFAKFFCH